jgi:ATP-dependent exoDNAse (exonuclease V) alpha subunit
MTLHAQPIDKIAESLSGLVERVTFFNEENGFSVLKVTAKGRHDLVTVVGSLPSVSAGEWLTAQGRWVQNKEFGLQFSADMLASTAPTTKEGIEKYLGSDLQSRSLHLPLSGGGISSLRNPARRFCLLKRAPKPKFGLLLETP